MLYILSSTEKCGLHCEVIAKNDFDQWLKDHTYGIKPERHPKFVSSVPNDYSDTNEFFVIDGQAVVPTPVDVVRTYTLL